MGGVQWLGRNLPCTVASRKEACNPLLKCLIEIYSSPGCDSIRETNHGPGRIKLFNPSAIKSHLCPLVRHYGLYFTMCIAKAKLGLLG